MCTPWPAVLQQCMVCLHGHVTGHSCSCLAAAVVGVSNDVPLLHHSPCSRHIDSSDSSSPPPLLSFRPARSSGPSYYVGNGMAAAAAIPTDWVELQLRLSLSRFQTCQAAAIPDWRQGIFLHACTSVELRSRSCELSRAPCGWVSAPYPSAPLVLM